MKKFLAAMLSTTILCSAMAACGNQSTTPDTDDTAQSSSSSTSTNVKDTIAVVTKTMNNPFHVTYGEASSRPVKPPVTKYSSPDRTLKPMLISRSV
ncbi:hypothetical protein DWV55_10250 [Butyricicoccus sp. AF10-3]|nr:hypothetical protein [Butyricicoccus sp. AF10-3]RHS33515.1 hypothetical protein DWV55_10250 [Butyricicoccus sp. AF10-3]